MRQEKKRDITMDELTKGYEDFIKGKKLAEKSKREFNKLIKKATKSKPRGSK